MKRLIVGNWKMHGLRAAVSEVLRLGDLLTPDETAKNDVMICPPATLISELAQAAPSAVQIGAQTCHNEQSGAYTGNISAEMLKDCGATAVIVGHSERRQQHNECNQTVRRQAEACHRAGLMPIICVGERLEQKEAGITVDVVLKQLDESLPSSSGPFVVAYEPVWAIGSGKVPTSDDILMVHSQIDDALGSQARLLYGGSVKPSNAQAIMALPKVHGVLVGGASLKADEFHAIIAS